MNECLVAQFFDSLCMYETIIWTSNLVAEKAEMEAYVLLQTLVSKTKVCI